MEDRIGIAYGRIKLWHTQVATLFLHMDLMIFRMKRMETVTLRKIVSFMIVTRIIIPGPKIFFSNEFIMIPINNKLIETV